MAGTLRKIGKVAGTVAAIASVVPGLQPVALVAGGIAAVASIGAQILAKPPATRGQVNERVIGANNPQPYLMGRSYSGGVQLHDVGYGGKVNDVENPYRFIANTMSCCGPVDAIEAVQADFTSLTLSGTAVTGYYDEYLYCDTQLGERPEPSALSPQWSGAPNWGSTYKTSSHAGLGWSLKWSKKGKRFVGGQIPILGAIVRGVKVYDPRLDSTYPGGSGTQRIDDETTWAYSTNPALHALAYSYGRYVNGVKVFGVDLGSAAINLSNIVAWANACDTNGWEVNGTIYEPGDKWNNLKKIAQAGGAVPVLAGGILSFDFWAPRVSLATIGRDDLAEGTITAARGKGFQQRHNTIVPRYRSEAHRWENVQSDAVAVAEFVAADGETKLDEILYELVTDKDQAAQLAHYEVYQRRERGPITIPCKPHLRDYDPGDAITLLGELQVDPSGEDRMAIIRKRDVNPITGKISLTLEMETEAKHPLVLGTTGTLPAIPYFVASEEIDALLSGNEVSGALTSSLIANSYVSDADPADGLIQGTDTSLTVEDHSRIYTDKTVSVTGATLTVEDDGTTALAPETLYHIYYDDAGRAGGTVSLKATQTAAAAATSGTNPDRHYVGSLLTDSIGGSGTSGGGSFPPGWNEGDYYESP